MNAMQMEHAMLSSTLTTAKGLRLEWAATAKIDRFRTPERGSALVMALVFLLVITLLALTVSSNSVLQLRMAGNLRNVQQAQMSADTALRGAEWRIWTSTSVVGGQLLCTDGSISGSGCVRHNPANTAMYGPGGVVTEFRTAQDWLDTGIEYMGPGNLDYTGAGQATAQLSKNPRYIIEDMGEVRPPGSPPARESGAGRGPGDPGRAHTYRITARAAGGSTNVIRIAQSTFDAQANN